MSKHSDEEAQRDLKAAKVQVVIAKCQRVTEAQNDVATAMARVRIQERDLALTRAALEQAKVRRDRHTEEVAAYIEAEMTRTTTTQEPS